MQPGGAFKAAASCKLIKGGFIMIRVRSFTSQDDFENFIDDVNENKWETVTIVRENDNIACDIFTDCKSYKTAIKRFFKALSEAVPELDCKSECEGMLESCENGYFNSNNGSTWFWGVESIDECGWCVFLNVKKSYLES